MLLSESGCNNKDTCIDIVSIVVSMSCYCVSFYYLLCPSSLSHFLSLCKYVFSSDLYYLEFGGLPVMWCFILLDMLLHPLIFGF